MDIHEVTLLLLTSAAACVDLRTGKIPNSIIAAGLICGFAGNCVRDGVPGGLFSLLGAAEPLLFLILLFYLHMIGAGDIKLLCMAGAFTGPVRAFHILIYTFLIGGVFSLVLLIKRGTVRSRLQYFTKYIGVCLSECRAKSYLEGVGEDGRFCFSVPILLGILAEMFL